jgi:hypothetical protein
MAVKQKKQDALLKKLKEQVRLLKRKEEQSCKRMQAAIKKVNKLSHTYKIRLARKMRVMQAKLEESQISSYAKAAADLEKQLLTGIKRKVKAFKAAAKRTKRRPASR